ncbi:hypothetical protein CC78DRAFT_577537 [Lojkania enalia]|uniref:PNPLA domain-containing protein n=1 Tax=Lojkania enalia TaxID=147567 RepID=A0A9P4KFI2_9PLEO|nr:hypothetical protein CC78DRAFT_577537 [Didymosphaeria enalia]
MAEESHDVMGLASPQDIVTPPQSPTTDRNCSWDNDCAENRESHLAFCSKCDEIYCLVHWPEERKHKPSHPQFSSHRQLPLSFPDFLQTAFSEPSDADTRARLHEDDMQSLWFGLKTRKDASPQFINRDAYLDIINTSGFFPREKQFPMLISFIGPTGAGKSTVIKALSLIAHASRKDRELLKPIPGAASTAGGASSSDLHLYGDGATIDTSNPILFADCEGLYGGVPEAADIKDKVWNKSKKTLNQTWRYVREFPSKIVGESVPTRRYCVEDLYPRILYSFSDVVCFVTQQTNIVENTLEKLVIWADKVLARTINQPTLPYAIIILNGTRGHPNEWLDEDEATKGILSRAKQATEFSPEIKEIIKKWIQAPVPPSKELDSIHDIAQFYFDEIRVVYIPDKNHTAPDILYRQIEQLRNRIVVGATHIQAQKEGSWSQLNSVQLQTYFNRAFTHFCTSPDSPFDFYEESKANCPLPVAISQHITHLMDLKASKFARGNSSDTERNEDRTIRLVASFLSLATLEREFIPHPTTIFESELKSHCYSAYERHYSTAACAFHLNGTYCANSRNGHRKGHQDSNGRLLGPGEFQLPYNSATQIAFVDSIGLAFRVRAQKLSQHKNTPSEYKAAVLKEHMLTLATERKLWCSIASNKTCLCCLMSIPHYVLPCRHALCEKCVKRIGERDSRDDTLFYVKVCPLCQGNTAVYGRPWEIRFMPACVGPRVLSLDGGGVRGIISVKILEMLEKQTRLDIPIHQFFDMIVGTSTGGIIALGLGCNLWSASKTCATFKKLAKESFKRHNGSSLPIFSWLITYFNDSMYRTDAIEEQLKTAFGDASPPTLFGNCGWKEASRSGDQQRALKVAVTTTACMTNEAFILANYNRMETENRVRVYREDHPHLDLNVWEAARCTSAAPMYFKAYNTANGYFQDGGLNYNNPIELAMNESHAIWPGRPRDDLVVSIGTGRRDDPPVEKQANWTAKLSGFLGRSFSSFMNTLDTEVQWRRFNSGLNEERSRFHRLNLKVASLPDLADISEVDKLEQQTEAGFELGGVEFDSLQKAADALVASLFYFRIHESAKVAVNSYQVKGSIHCRLEHKYQIKAIGGCFMQKREFIVCGRTIEIPSFELENVRNGVDFQLDFDLAVVDEDGAFSITLGSGDTGHHIGNSPWTFEEVWKLEST